MLDEVPNFEVITHLDSQISIGACIYSGHG